MLTTETCSVHPSSLSCSVEIIREWAGACFETEAEGMAANLTGLAVGAIEGAFRDGVAFLDYFPPITRLVAGGDGTIWVRREVLDEASPEPVRWQIFDAAGDPLAELPLPSQWNLLEASRSTAWVSVTVSMGVPKLVRLDLREETG